MNLGGSNISRSQLPHLHSKGVRIQSVNVNKGGASPLGIFGIVMGCQDVCVGVRRDKEILNSIQIREMPLGRDARFSDYEAQILLSCGAMLLKMWPVDQR